MADGFIVRKGGVAVDITAAPSINFVSKTFDSITFTITNNDVLTADIFWEIGDSTPDENTFSLAGGATSSNQVASGLDGEETYTIFAFANAEGKAGSQTTSQVRTTPAEPIVYTAATGGTTAEYDDGGTRYKSHTFTSSGTFTVTTVGNATDDRNKVDYLVIAGGAGGGGWSFPSPSTSGGGGGAGGYRTTLGDQGGLGTLDNKVTVTATTFGVTIGSGGPGRGNTVSKGGNGGTSSVAFSTTITSTGGGGGGSNSNGNSGGSGGGGHAHGSFGGAGGAGTANQGFSGGAGVTNSPGGGGGAGAAGQSKTDGANGGNGLSNILRTGSAETRTGGGGGGFPDTNGGTGGGGGFQVSGTVNTGSGGGGASGGTGGSGGSGIVVIRYEIAPSV